MNAVRIRFAPSPTGDLHVGNARTALFNWMFARSQRGAFVLRIEDSDTERSSPEHEAGLMEDLCWLGLGWDEGVDGGGACGPYRQSERLDIHRREAERLVAAGSAYPCFCDPDRLASERTEQRAAGRASLYSGRCRRIPPHEAAARRGSEPHALRFNVAAAAADEQAIEFLDRVHGTVRFPVHQIGDFVLLRRNGRPSYNFAVVVDDLGMKITHIIRGDDHLSNTPRQVLVARALGAASPPEFAHLPLIVGPGGAPLRKREGGVSVAWFREQGYPPEVLINALALLGWSAPGGQELLTREEILSSFDLDRVSKASAIFDRQKLDALAVRHMARLPEERLVTLASEHLQRAGVLPDPAPPGSREWVGRLARLFADRLARMAELPREAALLFDFEATRAIAEPQVLEALTDADSRRVIEALVGRIGQEPLTAQRFQALADEVRRETGAKGRRLYHPLRVALTGAPSGPELVKLIPIIEGGHRLKLSRPVASCYERARALLTVGAGTTR
jgi:glutamyl-tRNA synthetase